MPALDGLRVLVPRGGEFGERLRSALERHGATPVIAPVIAFEPPDDEGPLRAGVARLASGAYDWLLVTSATTVDVLASLGAEVPTGTKVAAVGPATAAALRERGMAVDFVPAVFSAEGMLAEWPGSGRVFLPQSEIAAPALATGLAMIGHEVDAVTAYRTVGMPLPADVAEDLAGGRFDAVLVTSGSVARQLAGYLAEVPAQTTVLCIGRPSADAATAAALRVDAVAQRSDGDSLIDALVELHS